MEEVLIELVRQHKPLYDKSHKDYKDRGPGGVCHNIWKSIWESIKELGYEVESPAKLQEGWDSLRDRYCKAKARAEKASASGAAGGKKSKWTYWDQMCWLDDFLKKRSTTSNIASTSQPTVIDLGKYLELDTWTLYIVILS